MFPLIISYWSLKWLNNTREECKVNVQSCPGELFWRVYALTIAAYCTVDSSYTNTNLLPTNLLYLTIYSSQPHPITNSKNG
jgi:hypothetical protein